MPQRKCRFVPLGRHPLSLVLCQVRFSPIRKMGNYIPAIQDQFRRRGYPLERAGKVQQVRITARGVDSTEQERWEYRTKDETWSITVFEDSVALQTTAYDRFEEFARTLEQALQTVLLATEHDRLGIVERIGLRYINLILPGPGEDFRRYLRPGLHGVRDSAFEPGSNRTHIESVGRTSCGQTQGIMIVRISQNDQGFDLPPDLAAGAPSHISQAKAGELATLIDIDHYTEGNFDPDVEWVTARNYELHDHIIETFHEDVASEAAIEAWR